MTDYGTLTLNADGTYSFTIADSAAVQAMAEGATVTVRVGYTITDADGDSSEAALTLNRDRIYQAAMLDPHTAAELSIDDIVKMCDDLIEAHGDMLPKYI